MSKKNLTKTENEYIEYIENYIAMHGYPPSIRDIARNMFVSVTTAHRHLTVLVDKNYLRYSPKVARSYTIKNKKGSA